MRSRGFVWFCLATFLATGCFIPSVQAEEPKATKAQQKQAEPKPVVPVEQAPDKVATAIMGTPIYRHAVRSVAYSPDGLWLAAGTGDGMVHVWDVKQKQLAHKFKAHVDWTFDLTFLPNGKLVSGGGDNLVKVIDLATGKASETFSDHTNDLHGVAVTSDGKWLVTSGDDKRVLLRSLVDKSVVELGQHDKQVTSVTISRDDKFAATSGRDNLIKLWDLQERKLVRTFSGHQAAVISVAFSPDGAKLVSGGHDQTVYIWKVKDGTVMKTFDSHEGWVFAVAFDRSGDNVLTGGADHMLRVFNATDGKLLFATNLAASLSDLALSPNGQVVAAGTSNAEVWFIELDGKNSKVLPEKLQAPLVKPVQPAKVLKVSEYPSPRFR